MPCWTVRATRHTSSCGVVAQNVYMCNSYLFQVNIFWLFFFSFMPSLVKAEFCRYHLALNFSTKIAFQQKFFEVLGAFLVLFSLFSTVVCSHSELWQLSKFNLSPEYLGIAAPHFFHLWKTAVFKSMFCFGTYCWKKHCNFWLRTPLYFTALSTFHKGLAI